MQSKVSAINAKRNKGSVGVESFQGRLRLRLPRELYGGKQKYLTLGLDDTHENRKLAEAKASQIEADIAYERFDPTLAKYGKKQPHLAVVPQIEHGHTTGLKDLWQQFCEYKATVLKPKSLSEYKDITKLINRVSNDLDPLIVRAELQKMTTNNRAKKALMLISAAYKWGMKHNKAFDNPYDGMYRELPKFSYKEEPNPNPFTAEEKQKILEAFANHGKGKKGISYSYYYPFVKFLFMTGCRPSEAIGLQWKNISSNFNKIVFDGSVVLVEGKHVRQKRSKNNRTRTFPCNDELQEFLKSIKPTNCSPENLVFPSRDGMYIRYNDFSRRAWHTIVDPIQADTTPYSCRDTFITEQVSKGISDVIVGKWCDNSPEMIRKHYFGDKVIEQIVPL
uniref:Integrase family protein n=1 Tax=Cyanothece sp. (strain PCC 7425 / ATCC 29141) TaxID=395961 RepID=B8HR85_CYAP4